MTDTHTYLITTTATNASDIVSLSDPTALTALGWTRGQYAGSIVYRMPKGGAR